MIDEKKIPQRIYIKDSQLAECEIEGVADARINAVPYKGGCGKICEYINVDSLWHNASEVPDREPRTIIIGYVDDYIGMNYEFENDPGLDTWNEFFKRMNVIHWCYFSDLFPKGGEK